MKPPTDDELILFYYGEAPNPEEIEQQLEASAAPRLRLADLRAVLDAVEEPPIPERSATYGATLWRRIRPQLEGRSRRIWRWETIRPRREWALAGALMVLLLVAFLTGREWGAREAEIAASELAEGRQRVLLVTVARHLERSEMLLLELVNAGDDGEIDLSVERQRASELGSESRLYRQAARQAGQADLAAILEQLELALVELANAPDELGSSDLGEFRLRLEDADLLFKVRVVGSRLRRESRTETAPVARLRAPREL